jgi:hypothetical protein
MRRLGRRPQSRRRHQEHDHRRHSSRELVRVDNHVRLLITGNPDWLVPAGLEERRFAVLDVGDAHREDHGYFRGYRAAGGSRRTRGIARSPAEIRPIPGQSATNPENRRAARPENRLAATREGDGCSTYCAAAGSRGVRGAPITSARSTRSLTAMSSTPIARERGGGASRRRSGHF